ncbi:thiamine phosphate synthase [Dyadobacter chenwenxiniae]|uniref:Thiamine-phosphate synthase n=1 Tax=Dyadobacter chenwenxiniae TaxID=2906456 RepID=A0A9X1PID7_9BACT|nr:thiamine phosphate synthase [Dyadobacter chenwenxiniae]MCF0060048.1 thiamine phosphate synthase [Dyadobacter chenwenxiniae]UON85788.1 thiamine phosphate synthase [Dyadobacter chenwenxiniae]
MELIAISHPEFIPNEAERINALFRDGLLRLHIRKPGCNVADLNRLIGDINPDFYSKIALHSHHELAAQYGITRLHFPEKLRKETPEFMMEKFENAGFKLSTSIHDIDELDGLSKAFDYTFFGPVFDSISKTGYQRAITDDFYLEEEKKAVKVIAIGGIKRSNLHMIKTMNFDGAAMLGAIWYSEFHFSISLIAGGLSPRQLKKLKNENLDQDLDSAANSNTKKIERLHFISNQTLEMSHLDSIGLALQAGCKWIQLRVKDQPENDVLELAHAAKALCDSYAAKLIINDFPNIAKAVDAYGLHLGLNDMPIPEARKIVGKNMTIGGTANKFEDILLRISEGADYIGLGPFRFTRTKQNLSPILGLEGYLDLMQKLSEQKINIPIIAIGGILPGDVPTLMTTGIHGVAMSSALIQSQDRKETVQKLDKLLC